MARLWGPVSVPAINCLHRSDGVVGWKVSGSVPSPAMGLGWRPWQEAWFVASLGPCVDAP